MKAIWLNDIHLDFLNRDETETFVHKLQRQAADCVLIAGDIAQAGTVTENLTDMAHALQVPIYFVLGNHDFYHGSIHRVRASIRGLVANSPLLHWLSESYPIKLTAGTCLVGHDGWGDCRLGAGAASPVQLNDFVLIEELTGLSIADRTRELTQLGDEAARHFAAHLPQALDSADHVVVLTHVPPFTEAAWYNGGFSGREWLPFFACKAVGTVLRQAMLEHPHKRMTVLCGHTHGGGTSQILPNLVTLTGPARYGRPAVQKIFEWD